MKIRFLYIVLGFGLLMALNASAERLTVQLMVKQTMMPKSPLAAQFANPEISKAGIAEDIKTQVNAGIVYEKGHTIEFPIVATIEIDDSGKITSFRSECMAPQRFFPGTPTSDGPPIVYYHEIHIRTPQEEYMRVEVVDSGRLLRHAHFVNVKQEEFAWPGWLTAWVVDTNDAAKYMNDIKHNKVQPVDNGSHWKVSYQALEVEIDKSLKWLQTNEIRRFEFFSGYETLPSVCYKHPEISYEFKIGSVELYAGVEDPFLIPEDSDIPVVDVSKQ